MRKSLIIFGLLALVLATTVTVYAVENSTWGKIKSMFDGNPNTLAKPAYKDPDPQGPAGNSQVEHLYLYEKNPSDWSIIEDGAWGKMTFKKDKNTFVLNGHGLEPNTEYALIHYMENWPEAHVIVRGYTNDLGDIHLSGSWDVWTMKLWLVLGSDITGDGGDKVIDNFTAWNPTEYLFEHHVLPSP